MTEGLLPADFFAQQREQDERVAKALAADLQDRRYMCPVWAQFCKTTYAQAVYPITCSVFKAEQERLNALFCWEGH